MEVCREVQQRRFTEFSSPPMKSQDPFFRYAMTTFFAVATKPDFEIGNLLLDLLENVGATFEKPVNHTKFGFKAKVQIMDLECVVKVRVYKETGTKYAIEFQRRSGDSICFGNLYKWAEKYIGTKVLLLSDASLD